MFVMKRTHANRFIFYFYFFYLFFLGGSIDGRDVVTHSFGLREPEPEKRIVGV